MAEKKRAVHFVLTGGTIDSFYDGTRDTVVPNKRSSIPSFVKSLKLSEKTVFTQVCMKDSRAFTRKDLAKITRTIEESKCSRVIVTHGTYTMATTAKFVEAHLKRSDQTIVFTGSLIPLVGFSPSDAPFNLGFALAKVQGLPSGVYVCMNARVFSPGEAAKIVSEGRFISVFG